VATDFESLAIASPSWCQLAEPDFEQTEAIPTMGAIGRLLFVGLLLIFGLTFFGRSQWAKFEPDSARSRF
jgi:hypothetical protein